MKIVGLTGGIGSGKTTVGKFFKEHGVPIYIADDAGKKLMLTSKEVKDKITDLFGKDAYKDNAPDKKYIASKVFNDKNLLEKLNAIIHPAVALDFKDWQKEQDADYVIYEAAILFETGSNKNCNYTILVTAPKETRITRLQKRDDSSLAEIEARMANQWPDSRKRELANFEIINLNLEDTKIQVENIHFKILKAGKN